MRVRIWQRKSLQSAFQIWGCGWGAGLAHPSQNEVYLCAAYAPLMRRSYQIAWAHLWDCPPRVETMTMTMNGTNIYLLKKRGAPKCYDHLCAEPHPVMRDSLRISSYSRKLCCMQITQGKAIKKVPVLSKIDLCELYAKNNNFHNYFYQCLYSICHKHAQSIFTSRN